MKDACFKVNCVLYLDLIDETNTLSEAMRNHEDIEETTIVIVEADYVKVELQLMITLM